MAQLRPGDVVIVKPNERLPADGFVIQGEGSVNQAPITGESIPVDKMPVENPQDAAANPDRLAPQYRAFAGTINGSGALEIQVTKLASDSTLARVVQMVNEAETQKSPTQRFADKFERYFVPTVLACVVLLLFAWAVIDEPFSASFYRAMAVLVAASPCALAISTPSAVLSGVARAARGGVLVKGGGPLDRGDCDGRCWFRRCFGNGRRGVDGGRLESSPLRRRPEPTDRSYYSAESLVKPRHDRRSGSRNLTRIADGTGRRVP